MAQRERLSGGADGARWREWFARGDDGTRPAASDDARVLPLAAHYLLHARRGNQRLDPVARVHLGHGAVLERVNRLGDTSPHGLARSCGAMVNDVFRPGEVEKNHELYVNAQRVMASRALMALADAGAAVLGTHVLRSREPQ